MNSHYFTFVITQFMHYSPYMKKIGKNFIFECLCAREFT